MKVLCGERVEKVRLFFVNGLQTTNPPLTVHHFYVLIVINYYVSQLYYIYLMKECFRLSIPFMKMTVVVPNDHK